MTTTIIELTEDEFDDRFPLIENHLNPNASWCLGEGRGCLFETYGEELEFVRQQDPRHVWTLIDGEDGDLYLTSGIRFVNRIGYLISTVAVPEGTDIEVRIPAQPDPEPEAHEPIIHAPWSLRFERDGTEDVAVIIDAQGDELLRSRHFWRPQAGDSEPATLAAMRLIVAAPKMLEFAKQVVRMKDREESVPVDIYQTAVQIIAGLEGE